MTALPNLANAFSKLYHLVSMAETTSFENVKDDLLRLYEQCTVEMENDSSKFLSAMLLHSYIAKKSGGMCHENIYLRNYEVSQIRLFELLIAKLPYVKCSQAIVNRKIVQLLDGLTEATLLDIGIGLGTQVRNILAQCKNLQGLRKLVIIGIEPGADALAAAQASILAVQAEMPFAIEFKGYQGFAEDMDLTAIDHGTSTLIVNASLALHHIRFAEQRVRVLSQIKAMHPTALFLIEPNVNHFEPDFLRRFRDCAQHFYAMFKTIDGLDIDIKEKSALKLFFGREIEDIIGKPETERFEKHELATTWINRLRQLEYNISNCLMNEPVAYDSMVRIAPHQDGFVGLSFGNETMVSIIYAS